MSDPLEQDGIKLNNILKGRTHAVNPEIVQGVSTTQQS